MTLLQRFARRMILPAALGGLALGACTAGTEEDAQPTSTTVMDAAEVETSRPRPTPPTVGARISRIAVESDAGTLVDPELPDPAVRVSPGQSIQDAVDANPPGTAFIIEEGRHSMQSVIPKDGNVFVGEFGAVLSGSLRLSGAAERNDVWVFEGIEASSSPHGSCQFEGDDSCRYNEELFVDDRRLRRVERPDLLTGDVWFYDEETKEILLGFDPTGLDVELSVVPHAFSGDASEVTIANLVITRYANPAQTGAINGEGPDGVLARAWTVSNCEVVENHGIGIETGDGMTVSTNLVARNGQLGIGGKGRDVLIEGNVIAGNNTAWFSWNWEAGGTKFVRTTDLVVRGNVVYENGGPGIWTDIDNVDVVVEDNIVLDNAWMGIFHEISYDAVIRWNTVARNGFGQNDWLYGAGIMASSSANTVIYENEVEGNANGITGVQQDRGSGDFGVWELRNLTVRDNVIRSDQGLTGVAQDIGDLSVFSDRNIVFEGNWYELMSESGFSWLNETMTPEEWQENGLDENGVFVVSVSE